MLVRRRGNIEVCVCLTQLTHGAVGPPGRVATKGCVKVCDYEYGLNALFSFSSLTFCLSS